MNLNQKKCNYICMDRPNYTPIKFKDGTMKVDMFTASAITKVYDAVNDANKKKMEPMLNGKKAQFMKIADFAMKQVRR